MRPQYSIFLWGIPSGRIKGHVNCQMSHILSWIHGRSKIWPWLIISLQPMSFPNKLRFYSIAYFRDNIKQLYFPKTRICVEIVFTTKLLQMTWSIALICPYLGDLEAVDQGHLPISSSEQYTILGFLWPESTCNSLQIQKGLGSSPSKWDPGEIGRLGVNYNKTLNQMAFEISVSLKNEGSLFVCGWTLEAPVIIFAHCLPCFLVSAT